MAVSGTRDDGGRPGPGQADTRPDGRRALLEAARAELAVSGPTGLSLRAVARRAGLSHAAPKHHFGDRAGILTALAAEGFRRLARALDTAYAGSGGGWGDRVSAMGRAYVDFGLAEPDLMELMFQTDQLHVDDAELDRHRREAFASLSDRVDIGPAADRVGPLPGPAVGLVAWALAHGLVVLARSRSFRASATDTAVATRGRDESADIARRLVDVFADILPPPDGHGHPPADTPVGRRQPDAEHPEDPDGSAGGRSLD